MKKFFLVLIFTLILGVTACSQNSSNQDEVSSNDSDKTYSTNDTDNQEETLENIQKIRSQYNNEYNVFVIKENGDVIPATPEYYIVGAGNGTHDMEIVSDKTEVPTITSDNDIIVQCGFVGAQNASAIKVDKTFPTYNISVEHYSGSFDHDLVYVMSQNDATSEETFFTDKINSINGQDPMSFLEAHLVKQEDITLADNDQINKAYYIDNSDGMGPLTINYTKNDGSIGEITAVNCTGYVSTANMSKIDLNTTPGSAEDSYIIDCSTLENGYYALAGFNRVLIKIDK